MDLEPFSCTRFLKDPTIVKVTSPTVYGPVFHVHKKLLAYRSTHFQERFEAQSQPKFYCLHTSDLICEWFVEWVYTDSVPEVTDTDFRALFEFFLLAQNLCKMPRLGDLVMDRIRQRCRAEVADSRLRDVIREYYDKVEAKSPMRRWLVKYVTWNIVNGKRDVIAYKPLIEQGGLFAMDLILTLMRAASGPSPNPSEEPDCKYHKHAEDVECNAQSFSGDDRSAESS